MQSDLTEVREWLKWLADGAIAEPAQRFQRYLAAVEKAEGGCEDVRNTLADLTTLASGFLTVYEAASTSDEEGLLQAVAPDEMRQLWHRVDEAAFDLREFLSRAANSQSVPDK